MFKNLWSITLIYIAITTIVLTGCGPQPFLQDPLVDTKWQFVYSVVKGIRQPDRGTTQLEFLLSSTMQAYNGCNSYQSFYEITPEQNRITISNLEQMTLSSCSITEITSDTKPYYGDLDYLHTLEQVVAYELHDGEIDFHDGSLNQTVTHKVPNSELWLYYPEDKSNIMVFRKVIYIWPPPETPTPK